MPTNASWYGSVAPLRCFGTLRRDSRGDEGLPWEVHMPFFYYFLCLKVPGSSADLRMRQPFLKACDATLQLGLVQTAGDFFQENWGDSSRIYGEIHMKSGTIEKKCQPEIGIRLTRHVQPILVQLSRSPPGLGGCSVLL